MSDFKTYVFSGECKLLARDEKHAMELMVDGLSRGKWREHFNDPKELLFQPAPTTLSTKSYPFSLKEAPVDA